MKAIARIHENTILSACNFHPLVHGVIDSFVFLRNPIVDVVAKFLDDINATIIRATIYDDVFVIIARQIDYAFDGSPETRLVIIVDSND